MKVCRTCARTLEPGEFAWVEEVKVIAFGGSVHREMRFECEECAA